MLTLTEKFDKDIQQNYSTVYPIIIIDNEYYISTIKEIIKSGDESFVFDDYGLKISNIKESVDVKSHLFKISNVTITLNNYDIYNIRLSDAISEKTNKPVEVYYKTQSCETLEDCLLVYKGILKRSTYDESNLSLTLEDQSNIIFQKDVPVANLGFSKNVFNKDYINRPIPIAYGEIQKAPVIPWIDEDSNSGKINLSIIADDVEEVTGSGRNITINNFKNNKNMPELMFEQGKNKESYFYIYKDDYHRVLQEYNQEVAGHQLSSLYSAFNQYSIDDSGQFLSVNKSFTGATPENPPAMNEFQTVKILRPNQAEILISEGGVAEEGTTGSIIDLEPFSGVLRPQASVDSEDNSTVFFDIGEHSEFSTFTQIPNNKTDAENAIILEDDLIVNNFTNSSNTSDTQGFYYPTGVLAPLYAGLTNYLWLMTAWVQANAHHFKCRFISAPSGNMVIDYTDRKCIELGWRLDGQGQFFKCYSTNNYEPVTIHHQYELSNSFKTAWINSCEGITGDESEEDGHIYFGEAGSSGNSITGGVLNPLGASVDVGDSPYNNSFIFANPNKFPTYPQTVYKITCDVNHPNNLEGIETIYVGQWDEATMSGALQSNERWINLFGVHYSDPYERLFNQYVDFATFEPFDLLYKTNPSDHKIKTQYAAKYNGIPIGYYENSPINQGASKIAEYDFAYGYGIINTITLDYEEAFAAERITMKGLCEANASELSGTYGGLSWWIMIDEDITPDKLLKNLSGQESYFGEFIDENCNTKIKKGTFIPCNNRFDFNVSGQNWGFNFTENFSKNTVTLTTGNAEEGYDSIPEQRLSVLYPLPNIPSTDVMEGETSTFVYGALSLNIPSEQDSNHNTTSTDQILVQAYATDALSEEDLEDLGGLNYNAEFVGGTDLGTNLIEIQGNDSNVFPNGNLLTWDVRDFNNESNLEPDQMYENLENYRIKDWDTPDYVNALALTYRIRNTEGTPNNRVSISTNISSIGLLQYSTFSNVFNSNLYADVFGRNDDEAGTYTDTPLSVIENPADVLYHFLEKELEAVDIVDRENWSTARLINNDIKLSFSLNEKINSKLLVENISKNTNLFPKFNANGNFSYSYISDTYNSSDVEIKIEDLIDFQFTRTASEDIKTLVNVKYKKDYETNEYTKQTGYCDGYDFFGNGEGGREVYKDAQWLPNENSEAGRGGYDYSYLGLKRTDNILEFESEFIRDHNSAVSLRDYIYLQNCNQHTIVKCTLPLKYIKLEVGDVVNFNKLYNNLKAFGEDYTEENYRNGQLILPYFLVTSATKSSKNIKIECMQLHKLQGDFSAGKGSLSRRSELGVVGTSGEFANPGEPNSHITLDDISIMEDFLVGINNNYATSLQKLSADLTGDGSITQWDLNTLEMIFNDELEYSQGALGDLTGDGLVNVTDVIMAVNYILGGSLSESGTIAADLNQDGFVNVTDIVLLVNNILSD